MKSNHFRITFRIPSNGANTNMSHPSNYKMNVMLVENLMTSLDGKFVSQSHGSTSRYEFELYEYDVPKKNETFVSDVLIDLGSESKITLDYYEK